MPWPVRRTSQNWGQQTAQPNDLYSDDILWGSGLQFGGTHEDGMFTSNDDYDLFLKDYNEYLQQVLNLEMHGEPSGTHNPGYVESSAATIRPSHSPTPLPTEMGSLPLGAPPNGNGATNWQSSWESEEVDVDLSLQVQELQLESPVPSTSNAAAGLGEPKKPRKREEAGVCAQCGETIGRKSDLRRHENTVHGREVHACPLCNIICSRKDALQRHISVQHNRQATATLE